MFALVRKKNQNVAVLCWLGGRGREGQSRQKKKGENNCFASLHLCSYSANRLMLSL